MGIIEVKRPDPTDPKLLEHCGMAVLISPRVAITCAHVVNAAIPRMLEAEDSPPSDTRLTLVFPMVAGGERRSCCVTKWRKMGSNPLDDIAVLELEQPAPTKAGTGVLTVTEAEAAGQTDSIIRFVIDDNHVRFAIDVDAAAQNGISVSSKLLSLALTVNPRR